MARRGSPRSYVCRRPSLSVQSLEARVTPSFSLRVPMSPEDVRQAAETRAQMYTPLAELPASRTGAAADLDLGGFTPLRINLNDLAAHLADAPAEFAPAPAKILAIPRPDGTFDQFNVWEVEMMEPALAAKFPTIRTWRGQGIDDPTAVLAADLTPLGFHAQVLGPNGRWYVDPYYHLETDVYAAYYPRDLANRHAAGWTESLLAPEREHEHPEEAPAIAGRSNNGQTLRTYRTAVAATGEYTAFFGGTVANGQAAIVTAVNRVSGIFETELAIRLILVGNNSSLVYTNAATDPYSNSNGGAMLSQNQTTVDNVIGSANYDLGHVFSTGGGGVAYLGVVGLNGWKAGGVTGSSAPVGDAFYVDYVIHEMGHQFDANHTFNGTNGSAGGNVNASTAYEPGSGSTIMAYAGICGADDLQSNSDPYFHAASLNEISDYIFSGAGIGNTQTATGNNIPTASAGADYTIPARTPFALTGVGTDGDPGDVLTYNWEQYDLGPAQALSATDNGSSPLFRSFNATTSPTRNFPRLPLILSNGTDTDEELPLLNQTMTFRLTVRDNRTTGAWNRDDMNVIVRDTGAPFAITSHNSGASLLGASTQTITWNVAGTNIAPINAALVNILLSTDGGQTFPTVLASSVANDGTEAVTIPNLAASQVRIKVQPVNNIFFDINNANLSIVAVPRITGVSSTAANGTYRASDTIPIQLTYNAVVNVTGTPTLALNSGGTATYASGSGSTTLTFSYTVSPGHNSADLDYTSAAALALNGGTIKATNGNNADLALPAPGAAGSLGANNDIVIDTSTSPRVLGVSSPLGPGTYGEGTVIPIEVTFSRAVVVAGTPQLALNTGVVVDYAGGTGTTVLTFNYTIGANDSSADLDYTGTTALSPNGGSLTDLASGSPADITLPAPGAAGSLGANEDLVIGIPRISLSSTTYGGAEGDTVSVTVNRVAGFAGAVSVPFTVTGGTATAADFTVLSPPNALTWADGENTPKTILIQLPDDPVSEGRETVNITLEDPAGPAEIGVGMGVLTITQSDGRAPGWYADTTDGDLAVIRVSPRIGAGTVLVYFTDDLAPISMIETVGTDPAKTVVSVIVRPARAFPTDGTLAVGEVIGPGVKSLSLTRSPLTGAGINLSGPVQSLRLDSLVNGADVLLPADPLPTKTTRIWMRNGVGNDSDVLVTAPLVGFNVGSFGNGRVEAPSIGSMVVRGAFGGDVRVSGLGVLPGRPALRSLRVVGTVDGSQIDVTGRVGSVTVGSFKNSYLYAGYTGNKSGGGTFDPIGYIGSFRTTAATGSFENSSVIGTSIGTVTLKNVVVDNADDKFGVYADLGIKRVAVTVPAILAINPTSPTVEDDFEVKVI